MTVERKEGGMSRLYNRRFKIGAGLFAIGFVIANVLSYLAASHYEALYRAGPSKIKLSGIPSFPPWGFPFSWNGDLGAIYNLALLVLGALFFGLLFRWITGIIK
jgi:hypothetical protein